MKMGYQPKENEVIFPIKPVGVKYICPSCHIGQMTASTAEPIVVRHGEIPSIKHYCDNCGAQLLLPKVYPYVEYVPVEEGDK